MNNIMKLREEKGVLVAAHRGVAGGNIPCNTIESYEAAIKQGADIVELDVSISTDGKLFAFHPGMERAHLGSPKMISELHSSDVEKLRYMNFDNAPTEFKVSYFEDVMRKLKDRCYVNIDKFWTCMPEITEVVNKLGMQEQVIVKTGTDEKYLDMVEKVAPGFAYMPVINKKDTVTENLLKRNINYIGAEVLFSTEADEVVSREYMEKMHSLGLMLWVNAIVYDYRAVISAHHTDDAAIAGNPDFGWGWLEDRGFDIVQTDWTMQMLAYYRYKKYRKD